MVQTDLQKLLSLLRLADKLASGFTGGYSGKILSAEEFSGILHNSIENLHQNYSAEIEKLYSLFAPTGAWDDFIGSEGRIMGDEIFAIISKLRNALKD